MIGPLSPRMVFAFVAALCALPEILRNIQKYFQKPVVLLTLLFVFYTGICTVRGYYAGNRMDVLKSDLKGFFWLFLVPVLISTVSTKARFEKILSSILAGAIVQAVCIIIINIVCIKDFSYYPMIWNAMMNGLVGNVDTVSNSVFRVFTKSAPYLAVGCAVVIFRQVKADQIKKRYVLAMGILLNGILFSYTRSVYGCLFVVLLCSFFCVFLFFRSARKKICGYIVISVVTMFFLVSVQELCLGGSYFNFALSRTFGIETSESLAVQIHNQIFCDTDNDTSNDIPDNLEGMNAYIEFTQNSDDLRSITMQELIHMIRKNPLFGNGLGASVPSRDNGLDEYFYLDVLARMGIVGLMLYLLPFLYIVFVCYKKRDSIPDNPSVCSSICGLAGFWAITWFNPWMNAVLGIAMYSLNGVIPEMLRINNCRGELN